VKVVCNNINLFREWSGLPDIINKFTYRFVPEPVDRLSTLFTIDTQIIHAVTFRIYL